MAPLSVTATTKHSSVASLVASLLPADQATGAGGNRGPSSAAVLVPIPRQRGGEHAAPPAGPRGGGPGEREAAARDGEERRRAAAPRPAPAARAPRWVGTGVLRRPPLRGGSGTFERLRTRAAQHLPYPRAAPALPGGSGAPGGSGTLGRFRCPVAAAHPGGSGVPAPGRGEGGSGRSQASGRGRPGRNSAPRVPGPSPAAPPRAAGHPGGIRWRVNPGRAAGIYNPRAESGPDPGFAQNKGPRRVCMEKYRREGSVVRLQTGLGATVRGARAGCARAGALQGTGVAAIPTSEGFLPPTPPPQSSYRRFNGTEGLQDLHLGRGEQSARSATGRGECVGGRGGLMQGICTRWV
ncbi:collagen alpha-1(I) chain-like [Corvus kubaryi]|uniref:collagen alpha-1(I) chain-like n=1 Tax=Corvus kubaryi TaxID=68294 RepID=UPI001C03B935|nr:collagen alpha-1(I) chain-like [Corvus kubaryi]